MRYQISFFFRTSKTTRRGDSGRSSRAGEAGGFSREEKRKRESVSRSPSPLPGKKKKKTAFRSSSPRARDRSVSPEHENVRRGDDRRRSGESGGKSKNRNDDGSYSNMKSGKYISKDEWLRSDPTRSPSPSPSTPPRTREDNRKRDRSPRHAEETEMDCGQSEEASRRADEYNLGAVTNLWTKPKRYPRTRYQIGPRHFCSVSPIRVKKSKTNPNPFSFEGLEFVTLKSSPDKKDHFTNIPSYCIPGLYEALGKLLQASE